MNPKHFGPEFKHQNPTRLHSALHYLHRVSTLLYFSFYMIGLPFLSLLSYIVIVPLSCVFVGMFRWELNYNQPYSHQYFISLQSSGSEVFSI